MRRIPESEDKPIKIDGEKTEGPEKHEEGQESTESTENEGSFEGRYEKLSKEFQGLERERSLTYSIAKLQREGLQTLIDEYGGDSVLDTIKKLNKEDGADITTYRVIKSIEPDSNKRADLFKKMSADASEQVDKFDQQKEAGWTPSSSGVGEYGRSFEMSVDMRAKSMGRLDSIIGRFKTAFDGRIIRSQMREFAIKFDQQGEELKKQLMETGGDTFVLVEERDGVVDVKKEKLLAQAEELMRGVTGEIDKITQELNLQLEEYQADILRDIGEVNDLDTGTEEMNSALGDLLVRVENEVKQRVELTENQITERTADLEKLVGYIESLKR